MSKKDATSEQDNFFYIAGHRGTRGLMPENTIPAMKKGMEVGANTLEFDLHITKDGKVVVYHNPSLDPNYTLMPDSSEIPKGKQKRFAFYHMNYDRIEQFIIGVKFYPQFPEQYLVTTHVPLLKDLLDSVETFTSRNQYSPVYYMPEIKSTPGRYGVFQPYPKDFVKRVMQVFKPWLAKISDRLIIQCHDLKVLKILHEKYPDIKLALLANKKSRDFDTYIKELGFIPDFYLRNFNLVTPKLIKECKADGIKIVPWTPDDTMSMKKLINMGVDGIITDYPNRLVNLLKD